MEEFEIVFHHILGNSWIAFDIHVIIAEWRLTMVGRIHSYSSHWFDDDFVLDPLFNQ